MTEPTEQEVEQKIADMIECLRDWPDMCEMYSERAADMLKSLSSRLAAERKDAEIGRLYLRWLGGHQFTAKERKLIDAAIAESTK